jgi:hypothetical protein
MGAGAGAGKQDKRNQPGAIHEVPGLREINWDLSPLPRAAVESFRASPLSTMESYGGSLSDARTCVSGEPCRHHVLGWELRSAAEPLRSDDRSGRAPRKPSSARIASTVPFSTSGSTSRKEATSGEMPQRRERLLGRL